MSKLTEDVSSLSSGVYYAQLQDWYTLLEAALLKHDCVTGPLPEIHTEEGQDYVTFNGSVDGLIYFTWYHMPSGNLEIISYVC